MRLDLRVHAVAYINHLSGLNRQRKSESDKRIDFNEERADILFSTRPIKRSVESSSSVPKPMSKSTVIRSERRSVYVVSASKTGPSTLRMSLSLSSWFASKGEIPSINFYSSANPMVSPAVSIRSHRSLAR